MIIPGPITERLKKRCRVDAETQCWVWQLKKDSEGYGSVKINHKNWLAHRAAYHWFVGPIPDGKTIDHLCRNTGCINPAHLEAVTMRENILRGTGPGALAVRTNKCFRGHSLDDAEILFRNGKPRSRACVKCKRYRRAKRNAERRAALTTVKGEATL